MYYYLLSRGLQRKRKSSPSGKKKATVQRLCPLCLQPIRRGVVMSFLLRVLVPPDLLLLGYGRS